jgi:hypothetical protein
MIDIKAIEERCFKYQTDYAADLHSMRSQMLYTDLPALLEAVKEARVLIKGLIKVTDEYANEFIKHKKAVDWAFVNESFCDAEAWLAKMGGE